MTSGVFLYNPEEGDYCFVQEEFSEWFESRRFLRFANLDDSDSDEDCYEPTELPEEQFEEYFRIAEDGVWYQVVAECALINYDGTILSIDDEFAYFSEEDVGVFKFVYVLQPVCDDINQMLENMLDTELDIEE